MNQSLLLLCAEHGTTFVYWGTNVLLRDNICLLIF